MESIELGERAAQIGYGIIADGMSASQDLMIFRHFGCLNARNLLYMQAELTHLESKLMMLDKSLDSMAQGPSGWEVPRSWDALVGKVEGGEQLEIVNEIRHKLDQYMSHNALLRLDLTRSSESGKYLIWTKDNALQTQVSILALKKPKRRAWDVLTKFIKKNRDRVALMPNDECFVREEFYDDLVALGGTTSDPMTSFINAFFAQLFQTEEDRRRTRGSLNFTSDGRIRRFVRILAVIVSSLLPILSIVALYFIQSQIARLYTIVGFSALCSFALSVLTDARNAEIIATTAAYAAIQVVFVSGDISS